LKKNFPYFKWKNILLMPLFLLLITSMTTTSVKAQNPYLSVNPPTATINAVGQTVTITVNVTEVAQGLSGFDIRIYYNQSIVSYTKYNYTVDGPGQVFPPLGTGTRNFYDYSVAGDLYLSLTLSYPTLVNATAGGTVVWITFQGLMEGISNLTFDDAWTFMFNYMGDPITTDPSNPGQITVIPEFPAAIATLLLLTTTLTATLLGKTIWSKKHHTKNKTN